MTLERTIEIPANRQLHFDLPPDAPVGRAKIELTLTPEPLKTESELEIPVWVTRGVTGTSTLIPPPHCPAYAPCQRT